MRPAARTILLLCSTLSAVHGGDVVFDTPSDDRWHYPFNFNPGRRPLASVFGSTADPDYTTFNDRDGIFLIGWRTESRVCPNLPPASYDVRGVRVILTNPEGATWPIDLTPDPWFNMDYPIADADPGQPIELFGMGFGPDYTYANWVETSPYVGSDDVELIPRDPYPFVFNTAGTRIHVEDSVKNQLTPTPWAVGVPQSYSPSHQNTPFEVLFTLDLNLSEGRVRRYFQDQLSGGRVLVAVTSLRETFLQAPSGFPTFYTKEGAVADPDGAAPILVLELVPTADLDGDTRRDADDWARFHDCLAGPDRDPHPAPPFTTELCLCLFDLDEDGDVDLEDAGLFAKRFNGGN